MLCWWIQWVRNSHSTVGMASLFSMVSGASEWKTQAEGSELLSEASFTHIWWLMLNVSWVPSSSLCGPLQWILYVCKLGLCHSMVAGFQDQVSWERKPGESSTVFYNLDFRVTSVAFCWIEVRHWGQSIFQGREQNPSPQWRSVSSILEEGHVGGHLLVWPSLGNIICYNIH